jgi:raffinose/stachyose/melibiose transport system permease protein
MSVDVGRRPDPLMEDVEARVLARTTNQRGFFRRFGGQLAAHVGLIIFGLISLYPLVWVCITSLKNTSELYADPFGLPSQFVWSNFTDAWNEAEMSRYMLNSLIVTVGASSILLVFSSMAAFALARFDFRFRGLIWVYVLFGFLVPPTLTLIPLAQLTRNLGIYDTHWGLILVYAAGGMPFNIFFLRSYMQTIPREIEEAALIDGAGIWRMFLRIILPLSKPALTTMLTFSVLYEWSEFMIALILTGSPNGRTLPVGVAQIATDYSTNQTTVAAAFVISIVPALVVFALLQRFVVGGLTAGAVKG